MDSQRLTNRIEDKVYYSKGEYAPTTLCVEMTTSNVRECMKRLAEYEDLGTVDIIKKALEKQTPQKVSEIDVDYGYFDCPNCDMRIWYGEEYLDHKYCLNCRQKLGWGDKQWLDGERNIFQRKKGDI